MYQHHLSAGEHGESSDYREMVLQSLKNEGISITLSELVEQAAARKQQDVQEVLAELMTVVPQGSEAGRFLHQNAQRWGKKAYINADPLVPAGIQEQLRKELKWICSGSLMVIEFGLADYLGTDKK